MAVFTGNGTVGSPSFTFSSDTDSGFYRVGADEFAAVTNGGERIRISNSGLVVNPARFNDIDFQVAANGSGNAWMLFADVSANAVGFQTASPAEAMHLGSGNFRLNNASGGAPGYIGAVPDRLVLAANARTTDGVFFDNTKCYSSIAIYGETSTGKIEFRANNVPNTTSAPSVVITGDQYLRMTATSGGIQFGGDTAAANALNDYEEGTWTPQVTQVGGTDPTYTASGKYVKIGNLVHCNCDVTVTAPGSGGGGQRHISLPFQLGPSGSTATWNCTASYRSISALGIAAPIEENRPLSAYAYENVLFFSTSADTDNGTQLFGTWAVGALSISFSYLS